MTRRFDYSLLRKEAFESHQALVRSARSDLQMGDRRLREPKQAGASLGVAVPVKHTEHGPPVSASS